MASELSHFDQIFSVRRFPPGRLYTVLLAMRLRAAEARLQALLEQIDSGIAEVKTYVKLRRLRQNRRLGRGGGAARKVDRVIDDDIVEIAHIATREADRFPNTASGKAARLLVDAFFIQGVGTITQIPYDEELAVVEHMIPVMRADHAEAIQLLGIERLVSRIERHLPEYRDALAPTDDVTAGELASAYEAMQLALLRVLGWTMVMVDDAGLRDELMTPMRTHDAQLAAIHAARRRGATGGDELPAEDIAVDGLDLDGEAIEALDAADRADAEARAEVEAAVDADAQAAEPAPPASSPLTDAPGIRPVALGDNDG